MDGQERIEIGSAGFGEASNATLEERARQIAESDGRAEVNDLDREEARRQLNEPLSEREDAEDQIAEGDRPDAGVAPASLGKQKEKTRPDDESLVPEKLVREGVEEAEFDTRVRSAKNEASSDPNG
ncbi:MAG TPA: hypothetical protein VIZ87_04605 [Terrimicrobium sp.]|jgi:hypothetical protein